MNYHAYDYRFSMIDLADYICQSRFCTVTCCFTRFILKSPRNSYIYKCNVKLSTLCVGLELSDMRAFPLMEKCESQFMSLAKEMFGECF